MFRKLLVPLVVLGTVAAGIAPAAASGPVRSCADLVRSFDVPDARTSVISATVVTGTTEFCDVRGTIEPRIGFQLKLPLRGYQGRYLQYGCGGFCGAIGDPAFPSGCGPAFGDAAVAATDDGHQSSPENPFDTTWAVSDQKARDDYFFRAPHALSKVSKHIISVFYGKAPSKSYFSGCSNGGREGLLLAQRYPRDFDGIIASAPGAYYTALIGYQAWIARNTIPNDKIVLLHNAVMAACDGLDGLVDGQIDDPRLCRFDPGTLAGQLTGDEIARVRRLYTGPSDGGVRLYPGGQPYGSEISWTFWLNPTPGLGRGIAPELADNGLKHLVYPIGTPHSSLESFEFTVREFRRLVPETVKANSLSLDLRAFQRAGGKLIIWHGAGDQGIPFEGTLDYWQRLTGGKNPSWARLFVVPSMWHCAGGDTLTAFDPFRALVSWVEGGRAPSRIIAEGRDPDGNVVRTRPVFPYPMRARYDGSGSVDDAANFVAAPGFGFQDRIRWAGEDLYRSGPVAP
ncbi:tannase/feruloyl esterase family alpha/beta hydrolase [Lentzea sp. BCCO 10_0798]|uniref:Tannase/feruloyl esterase family alpha/beta hydrolase n=1 Tax=Lentzea kristufekii TaxID=3095430 RepID=A0ABU4U2H1_9PSEU|nr:tannase/feruloyl esterase family alpha/beta hydrolase [Lentzea sp. BCCO 10_0798]MDX8054770.1 tannase/feruloyl esterase family alpha/beta hydrolase [Lentzea sp. BCCO 10_0798]